MTIKYSKVYIGDLELDLIPDTASTLEVTIAGNVVISNDDEEDFLKELTRLIAIYRV